MSPATTKPPTKTTDQLVASIQPSKGATAAEPKAAAHDQGVTTTREEMVSKRAAELWEESGRRSGRDLDNWLQAEQEVLAPVSKK